MTSPPEPPRQDLDACIADAEARLVARQDELRLQWNDLRARVEHATQPRRLALPVVAATLSLLALWWLFRRPEPAREPHPRVARPTASTSGLRWLRWAAIALPLLPLRWRAALPPTTASGIVGFALPLVHRAWKARAGHVMPPATMAVVDLERYAGHWYEIARLPTRYEKACATQPSAEYRLCPQGMQVTNRCRTAEGRELVARGLARLVPGSGGARLEVSFAPSWLYWLSFVWSDYWILHVDDDYGTALVGTPARDALWLLSRQPEVSVEQFGALTEVARRQGYELENLRML